MWLATFQYSVTNIINWNHLITNILKQNHLIINILNLDQWSQTQFLEDHSSAEFSSNHLQITPTWKFLVILKTLISWIICVWSGLELNCAEFEFETNDLDCLITRIHFYVQYYYFKLFVIIYRTKHLNYRIQKTKQIKNKQGVEWANMDCWNTTGRVLHKSRLDRLEEIKEGLPYRLELTM